MPVGLSPPFPAVSIPVPGEHDSKAKLSHFKTHVHEGLTDCTQWVQIYF